MMGKEQSLQLMRLGEQAKKKKTNRNLDPYLTPHAKLTQSGSQV